MKKDLKNILLIIFIIGSMLLVGCGALVPKNKKLTEPLKPDVVKNEEGNNQENENQNVEENNEEKDKDIITDEIDYDADPSDPKFISEDKTIYEFVKIPETEEEQKNPKLIHYLTEDHPEIIKIKKVVEEFSRLWSEANYETHKGDEWFHLYHQEALEEAIETKEAEESREFAKKYKIITTYLGIEYELIQLGEDLATALVQAKIVESIDNCTEALETDMSLKQGDKYCDTVRYLLWKENDIWKIVDKEAFNREVFN